MRMFSRYPGPSATLTFPWVTTSTKTLRFWLLAVLASTVATLAAAVGSGPASALTSVDGFVAQWNGKPADYDRAYGAQCVDLFNFYNRDVVGAPFVSVGYAHQIYDRAPSQYNRLPASAGAAKGDVAVWTSALPNGTGGAGHVAIVLADLGSSLRLFSQNPGNAREITMSKSYLRGYLRPRSISTGTPPPPPAQNPQGNVDGVSSPRPGAVAVRGWAFDRDNAGAAIDIHVYVGGEAGTPGAEGHPLSANVARPDVNSAHGIGGNHGFDTVFDTAKTGSQRVCLYAINIGGGSNVALGCRQIDIVDPHLPRGVLDAVEARGPVISVRGWAFDPDTAGTSIRVHVYVGPQPGESGGRAVEMTANARRDDVNKAFSISGRHGFGRIIVTRARGPVKVCAYAINAGAGSTNPQIGCKTVTR